MTTLNTKLIKTIIGSNEEVEFLFNKLNFLEKLTNEYDSVTFDERLQSIIDNADEISFNGLIWEIYKHIGELVINYKFNLDEYFEKLGISNYDVIEKYNLPFADGINTVYNSILEHFDFENITKKDISEFKKQIRKDFGLQKDWILKTSVLDLEDEYDSFSLATEAEEYLNSLLKETEYEVEIYETDDSYEDEDDEVSSYAGKTMYEGKLIHKDTKDELEDSISGRYCEISSVFEELLDFVDSINKKYEVNSWLKNSCCPKCKKSDYEEEQLEFTGVTEIFRHFVCSCGAKWSEKYNLTKVFFENTEEEVPSETEEMLAYENKRMGDFLENLGLNSSDITDLVINGTEEQKEEALRRIQTPLEVTLNFVEAQEVLDLLNDNLFHSDSHFTHDCDKMRIYLEIGNDLDDEEFKAGYEELKKILGVSTLNSFIIVDY